MEPPTKYDLRKYNERISRRREYRLNRENPEIDPKSYEVLGDCTDGNHYYQQFIQRLTDDKHRFDDEYQKRSQVPSNSMKEYDEKLKSMSIEIDVKRRKKERDKPFHFADEKEKKRKGPRRPRKARLNGGKGGRVNFRSLSEKSISKGSRGKASPSRSSNKFGRKSRVGNRGSMKLAKSMIDPKMLRKSRDGSRGKIGERVRGKQGGRLSASQFPGSTETQKRRVRKSSYLSVVPKSGPNSRSESPFKLTNLSRSRSRYSRNGGRSSYFVHSRVNVSSSAGKRRSLRPLLKSSSDQNNSENGFKKGEKSGSGHPKDPRLVDSVVGEFKLGAIEERVGENESSLRPYKEVIEETADFKHPVRRPQKDTLGTFGSTKAIRLKAEEGSPQRSNESDKRAEGIEKGLYNLLYGPDRGGGKGKGEDNEMSNQKKLASILRENQGKEKGDLLGTEDLSYNLSQAFDDLLGGEGSPKGSFGSEGRAVGRGGDGDGGLGKEVGVGRSKKKGKPKYSLFKVGENEEVEGDGGLKGDRGIGRQGGGDPGKVVRGSRRESRESSRRVLEEDQLKKPEPSKNNQF